MQVLFDGLIFQLLTLYFSNIVFMYAKYAACRVDGVSMYLVLSHDCCSC